MFLGKWVVDENDQGLGFWHGQLCPDGQMNAPRLGAAALRFLAKHTNHDVFVGSDYGGLVTDDVTAIFRDVDDEYQ